MIAISPRLVLASAFLNARLIFVFRILNTLLQLVRVLGFVVHQLA